MRAAVENDAAVGTEDLREAGRLPARIGSRRRLGHGLVAEAALEGRVESFPTALGLQNPRSQLEGRPVSHVPLMAAGELGHPVAMLVLVVADDRTLHRVSVRRAVEDEVRQVTLCEYSPTLRANLARYRGSGVGVAVNSWRAVAVPMGSVSCGSCGATSSR